MNSSNLSDLEILLQLKTGNKQIFNKIYEHYWKKLFLIAYHKLRDKEEAEEIVQEVFVTLWNKRENLAIENLNAYLSAMLRYAIYAHISKEKSTKNRELLYDSKMPKQHSFEESLHHKFILEKIFALSESLPEKCKKVFQYNKMQDRPLAEVAEQLNITQKTAEAHLTKALKIIRINLKSTLEVFFISFFFN